MDFMVENIDPVETISVWQSILRDAPRKLQWLKTYRHDTVQSRPTRERETAAARAKPSASFFCISNGAPESACFIITWYLPTEKSHRTQ